MDAEGTGMPPIHRHPTLDHDAPAALPGRTAPRRNNGWWAAAIVLIAGLLFLWQRLEPSSPRIAGVLIKGSAQDLAPGDAIKPGATLRVNEASILETDAGYQLNLTSGSEIELITAASWQLHAGRAEMTAHDPKQDAAFRVPGATVRARQARLVMDVTSGHPALLTVLSGTATLIPDRALPRHYWPMDDLNSPVVQDRIGSAPGTMGPGATHVTGLIGAGAIAFDNTKEAYVVLGSGGGEALATGSFAMDRGISVEALFTSKWSATTGAEQKDTDAEIFFRKQDKNSLIVLLQMKHYQQYPLSDPPVGSIGPALVFGLYLIGPGYGELTVPLDGREGRPTLEQLTDGTAHHVVATYDSRSGIKAIWFDGRQIAEHRYTPGSRILSGGPGAAHIGNSPIAHSEPFTGEIDEVAVYDVPLSGRIIRRHAQRAANKQSYFDPGTPGHTTLQDVHVISAGETLAIDPDYGLPLDPNTARN